MRPNTLNDFWARVRRSKRGACWLWRGQTDRYGYGVFRMCGRTVKAHRLAYETAYGAPGKYMCVCHACDVRGCCNPRHLFAGTNAENTADRQRKSRQATGARTRPETRAKGEANGSSKLTRSDVRRIRRLATRGTQRQADIGRRFGVTQGVVSKIKRRALWAHL